MEEMDVEYKQWLCIIRLVGCSLGAVRQRLISIPHKLSRDDKGGREERKEEFVRQEWRER
jgi:hypothetical protein